MSGRGSMRLTRRSVLGTATVLAGVLAWPGLAPAQESIRVAIVMPGNITDKSWNQSGYEGLMRAKDELGIEVAYSEKVAQPDQAEAMADYARRGYDVVIGHGGEFQEAANRVASRPSRDHVRRQQRHRAGRGTLPPRTSTIGSSAIFMGYLAGKMSKTGKGGLHRRAEDQVLHSTCKRASSKVSRRHGRTARCSSPRPTTGTTSPRARKRRSIRSPRGPMSSSRPWTMP